MPLRPKICFSRLRSGFTLIEILVVVAIIALLVSILLPSLNQAREQSKIVKCLANLSALAKGTNMYVTANKDQFCWAPVYKNGVALNDTSGIPLTRTWYFGGNRGQNSAALQTGGFYGINSNVAADWTPVERPLNKYVYNTAKLSKTDNRPLRKEGDLRIYECPSDKGVRWNGNVSSPLQYGTTAYLELGTSYEQNSCWYYYAKVGDSGGNAVKRITKLISTITRIFEKKGPSRAVILYEDPADWGMTTADAFQLSAPKYKVESWHKKYDIHNVTFLDGHAAATPMDWRKNRDTTKMPAWQVGEFQGDPRWVVRQNFQQD
jgi:prepilin-type N-terminal cleavage/methylation domain-containing protein/prepilin-type processing-associated H-X9-DG protein